MSKSGIIGLGNRTTLHYIDQINKHYSLKHGGYSTCPFILINANFDLINPYLPDQFEQLKENLKPIVEQAKFHGIKRLLFPNITLHETLYKYPELTHEFEIIDPINEVLKEIDPNKNIIIVGSQYTSASTQLKNRLKESQIITSSIDEKTRSKLDQLRLALYEETESKQEVIEFNQLVHDLSQNHIILIACTELSTALSKHNSNVYDLVQAQVKAFINYL